MKKVKKVIIKKAKARLEVKQKKEISKVAKMPSKSNDVQFEELDELDGLTTETTEHPQAGKIEIKKDSPDVSLDELDDLCSEGTKNEVPEEKEQPKAKSDDLDFGEEIVVASAQDSEMPGIGISEYSGLRLNYEKLYIELKTYSIKLDEVPTIDQINVKIARVQAMKDRVSNMLVEAIHNTRVFKKLYEIEYNRRIVGREEKSKEQREAVVHQAIRKQLDEYKDAETYLEVVQQVYDNLVSANDNISRQVTVMQEQIKLGDFSRPALPPSGKTSWSSLGKK